MSVFETLPLVWGLYSLSTVNPLSVPAWCSELYLLHQAVQTSRDRIRLQTLDVGPQPLAFHFFPFPHSLASNTFPLPFQVLNRVHKSADWCKAREPWRLQVFLKKTLLAKQSLLFLDFSFVISCLHCVLTLFLFLSLSLSLSVMEDT